MTTKEFNVGQFTYTHHKLDAFSQLNISRKGAPLFIGMANSQWFNVLHEMSQEDLDILIKTIMPFVQRKDPGTGTWAPIYNKTAERFSYEDIGGGQLLEIVFEILMVYLPDFIQSVGSRVSGTQASEIADSLNSEKV